VHPSSEDHVNEASSVNKASNSNSSPQMVQNVSRSFSTPKKESPSPKRLKMLNNMFKKIPNCVTVTMNPAHPVPINVSSLKGSLKSISKTPTKNLPVDVSQMKTGSPVSASPEDKKPQFPSTAIKTEESTESNPKSVQTKKSSRPLLGGKKSTNNPGVAAAVVVPLPKEVNVIGTVNAVRNRRLKTKLKKLHAALGIGNLNGEGNDNGEDTNSSNGNDSSSVKDFLEYGTSRVSILPKSPRTAAEEAENFAQVSKYFRDESMGQWSLWNNSFNEPNQSPYQKGRKDLNMLDSYDVVGYNKQANKYLVLWRKSPDDKFSNDVTDSDDDQRILNLEATTDAEFMLTVMENLATENVTNMNMINNPSRPMISVSQNNNNNNGDKNPLESKSSSLKAAVEEKCEKMDSGVKPKSVVITKKSSDNCTACVDSSFFPKIGSVKGAGGDDNNVVANGSSVGTNGIGEALITGDNQDIFVTGLGLRRKDMTVVESSSNCNSEQYNRKSNINVGTPTVDLIDLTID